MDLHQKKCQPCRNAAQPMSAEIAGKMLKQIPEWKINRESNRITRKFEFDEFMPAMEFVNKVAQLAEEEGHHPDFFIHYNRVELILWTHKIGGLHENDFIMAAKIDRLA